MKIKLHVSDWQKEYVECFLDDDIRYLFLAAGRRAGKSTCCKSAMLVYALKNPESKTWYVGNNYSQSKEQFESICSQPGIQHKIAKVRVQPYGKIKLTNGSEICFRTYQNPRALRGSGINRLIMDESQDVSDPDEFYSICRPLISECSGQLSFLGQFRGQDWRYKDFYIKGQKNSSEYHNIFRSWRIPSWRGVSFQNEAGREELRLAKQQIPDLIWRTEYACEVIANQRAVFRPEDIENANSVVAKNNGKRVVALDLGKTVDPSSIIVLDGNEIIYSEVRPLNERHELGAHNFKGIVNRFHASVALIDSTGGANPGTNKPQDEYTKLYRRSVPLLREFFFNYETKKRIVEGLCLALERGMIRINKAQHKELYDQLLGYEYKLRAGGTRIEYSSRVGEHDDLVMALAMAWYARKWVADSNLNGIPASV